MRHFIALVLLWSFLTLNSLAKEDESRLIRRAYIDMLGIVPTIEEIDWYCVYNDNSYVLAVEYILEHSFYKWFTSKSQLKVWLLSDDYKNSEKKPLTTQQINKIIVYVAGDKHEPTLENVNQSIKTIINHANKYGSSDSERIDYICSILMARESNKDEANFLLSILREQRKITTEEKSWLFVFEQILLLEDIKNY
jgi:hypothetical protein